MARTRTRTGILSQPDSELSKMRRENLLCEAVYAGIDVHKEKWPSSTRNGALQARSALALTDLPLDTVLVGAAHGVVHLRPLPINLPLGRLNLGELLA